ncbi:MFS transporter [Pseudoclavibacter sp. RFBA6]|uniref:MFS transporter n=1 Tax=Pseudoclavibacter sp. RFBA6 TaxID=2080573 RepID=UPI00215831ED|nr:MFS transporter [Pseudoclavibacter sp. RFBA6]
MTDDTSAARPRWGLTRYVTAATLARSADGGGVVAIVLIVTASGAPGWLAGVLGASLTAPHLLGPLIARRLDTARDGRNVIAFACVAHGATLAAAVLLYPLTWAIVPAALLALSGLFGPFLTGGISSRLPAIAGADRVSQRRAQGWDVATYGLGGALGPSVVAAIAAWSTPTAAALVLAAGTFVAAVLVRFLPPAPAAGAGADVPRPFRTLRLMLRSGRLRRTLSLTVIVAFSVATLPIVAVASTATLDTAASAAAVLTAAYGVGNLLGSAGVTIRPLRGEADALLPKLAAATALGLLAVMLSPSFWFSVAAYAAVGVANACFFAATLAARSEYSPPEARGQVFVWVGALKITAGSAGTAATGAIVGVAAALPLLGVIVAIIVASAVALLERVRESRRGLRAGHGAG